MANRKKVLNSSVILAENSTGQTHVYLGKGIGYGRKPGQSVSEEEVDQMFASVNDKKAQQLLELMTTIPAIYAEITQKIVAYAEGTLNKKLNSGIYFSLMDHLHFAVERFRKDIVITNRVHWEMKHFYPGEFSIGLYAVDLLNRECHIDLPEQEAANVAFHIINAQEEDEQTKNAMQYAKMISNITNIVKYHLNINFNTQSIHYQRFITHVKFFVERFYAGKLLEEEDVSLFEHISNVYPEAMDVASKVKAYLDRTHGAGVSKEELTYLAIHVNRLQSYEEITKP